MKILLGVKFQIILCQITRGPCLIERVLQQIVSCDFLAGFLPEYGNFDLDSLLGCVLYLYAECFRRSVEPAGTMKLRILTSGRFRFNGEKRLIAALKKISGAP